MAGVTVCDCFILDRPTCSTSNGCVQVKSVRPVVMYRKHSQRRVASAQPSNGASRRSRQLLSAALAPPQSTKLYNGNATRAYNVNNELGVTGKGVAVGVIDTGAVCC